MFDCFKQVVVVALLCFGGSLATKYVCLSNETRINSSNLIVLYSFLDFLMYVKRMGWGKITPPALFLIGLSYQAYFWYITWLSY